MRDYSGDERAQGWQAGAYYANVAFYCGPGGGADIVICLSPLSVLVWNQGYRGIENWGNVQVGSDESEIFFRATRRQTLVTQTLDFGIISLLFILLF